LLVLLLGTKSQSWTLQRIELAMLANSGLPARNSITRVRGLGFKASAEWQLWSKWSMAVASSHFYMDIQQNDPVIHWNWPYWQKIYGGTIAEIRSKEMYQVKLKPVQRLQYKPCAVTIKRNFTLMKNWDLSLSLGGGMLWFQRKLWLNEDWDKYFANLDYTFEYNFRNYAQTKSGWLALVTFSPTIEYRLNKNLTVYSGFTGCYYFRNRQAAQNFPLVGSIVWSSGIGINY